jgi:hypothetical protein
VVTKTAPGNVRSGRADRHIFDAVTAAAPRRAIVPVAHFRDDADAQP